MKENQAIREHAKKKGVKLWQIALSLGISEPSLIRWMRVPLSPEKEKMILDAIDLISMEAV